MNQAPRKWWDWPVLFAVLLLIAGLESRCDSNVQHFVTEGAP